LARPKKATKELRSIDECTAAMGELLQVTIALESAIAIRDRAIAELQAEYESQLDEYRRDIADIEASLEAYYYAHMQSLEDGGARKHFKLPNGVIGRRFGAGKLVPLNRSWTWKTVEIKVRELWGMKYFRAAEPEIDKQALKEKLDAEQLASAGLKVQNDESFYAEPARPNQPSEVRA
jgi:phage host-nuclease inhibitor protein Gam